MTGDGAASNAGAGCVTPDHVAVNVGTSAAIRAVEPADQAGPVHPELWRYLVDDRRVVSGAAFSGAGNLYAWLRQVTNLPAEDSVEDELATVPPGSRGVVVMPYHAGSRPPLDLAAGAGAITGISLATTPVEILAATLEAVCYRLAAGYEALASTLPKEPEVVASGGAIVASPGGSQPWPTCSAARPGGRRARGLGQGGGPARPRPGHRPGHRPRGRPPTRRRRGPAGRPRSARGPGRPPRIRLTTPDPGKKPDRGRGALGGPGE